MKCIDKFVNTYTGVEYTNRLECEKSEIKSRGINKLFKFWKKSPKDKGCDFANGYWCYQRTREEFYKLIDTIILAVKKYEPWIYEQYKEHGGIKREYVIGHTMLGRYLDDGDSELYRWWGLQGNICPKCFREYGQMYFASHCNCDGTVMRWSNREKIPTRDLATPQKERR